MESAHRNGEMGDGAWTGAAGYNTLFCACLCILGCTFSAGGRRRGGQSPSLQAGRRLRLQPFVPPLPRRQEQLPAALAAAPGSARGSGPCLPTPGTRPRPEPARSPPGAGQGQSPREATRTRVPMDTWTGSSLSAPGTRGCPDGSRCRQARGEGESRCRLSLQCPLPGRLFLSRIYGRFAAGADLSSSVRGNECCYLNALPPQPLRFRFSKSSGVPRGSPLLPGCET